MSRLLSFWYKACTRIEKTQAMKINTGKGTISLGALLAIWSISAIASLPGLAVSPILGDLTKIFPSATELELQMLTSLPSLLIIPFVLVAGKLSEGREHLQILGWGLFIFLVSGIACLFAKSMLWLILISCLLGIGAGMVIPLSTGLVVKYFTGDWRVRQLGYSSAINNLSLVLATAVAGYLAEVNWHLPFLVYTLPAVSLLLMPALKREPQIPEPKESLQLQYRAIDRPKLTGLMLLYFFITYAVLVITYDVSFLVDHYHLKSSFSGVLISLFFLAIMLPGFFLNGIIRSLKSATNLVGLVMMAVGLLVMGYLHTRSMLIAGVILSGLGYGIMQPIIYDKAATIAPPRSATLALSFVMAMNYLAVMACPFILSLARDLFHMQSEQFPFRMNAVLMFVVAIVASCRRNAFVLGLDERYFTAS